MTDYGTSRYGDALAEWADAIVGDGFADETVGSVDAGGHYALVTLYHGTSADKAESAAAAAYPDSMLGGARVILRTDSQGFVDVHYGPAHPTGDPRAYGALMAEWRAILADDAAEDTNHG